MRNRNAAFRSPKQKEALKSIRNTSLSGQPLIESGSLSPSRKEITMISNLVKSQSTQMINPTRIEISSPNTINLISNDKSRHVIRPAYTNSIFGSLRKGKPGSGSSQKPEIATQEKLKIHRNTVVLIPIVTKDNHSRSSSLPGLNYYDFSLKGNRAIINPIKRSLINQVSENFQISTVFLAEKSDKKTKNPDDVSYKFTSPAASLFRSPTQDSAVSLNSLQSLAQTQNNKETTQEEISITNDISKYHGFRFKLITEDVFYQGTNGVLRKWKAGEDLGNGSYGNVLKAFDTETGEIFAVKRLFYNKENDNQSKTIQMMESELKILNNVSHPHIVKYLGNERIHDTFCIYFEYMPGSTISKLLYNLGPMPESMVKLYLRQIISGLVYLHSLNILHRDIKGSNILIDAGGVVKLSDFGCSTKYINCNESGLLTSAKGSLP